MTVDSRVVLGVGDAAIFTIEKGLKPSMQCRRCFLTKKNKGRGGGQTHGSVHSSYHALVYFQSYFILNKSGEMLSMYRVNRENNEGKQIEIKGQKRRQRYVEQSRSLALLMFLMGVR